MSVPGRRRPIAVVLIIVGCGVAVWIPSFVAGAYAQEHAAAVLANPTTGWAFLWDAITASRNPHLGTPDAARQAADEVWAGAPAVVVGVTLKTLPSPWTVPVPPGGAGPRGEWRMGRTSDALNWVGSGRVNGGVEQVIGVLDYRTGRVEWDIRPITVATP